MGQYGRPNLALAGLLVTFLVPAHPGSPGQIPEEQLNDCVCVCLCVCRKETLMEELTSRNSQRKSKLQQLVRTFSI